MAGMVMLTKGGGCGGRRKEQIAAPAAGAADQECQLSVLAFLLTAIRKSVISCRVERQDDVVSAVHHLDMEISWPTDVRHVTHVTFDRFHGFLGLPVEFQVEIPVPAPSASASVFGVSPESMQCSYDSKGNSVPTILLLMQERLYCQGGLKAEGIFRINPENSQEEHVRGRLNKGIVPDDIDVHCLAGLIKAWFRELPEGVLDGLSPEQVLQCNSEEECVELVKLLRPTQAALLYWAVELMADVVEEEDLNKMNARNIAMVFAPNMTQMADPLTALMHAVQVMNLLKNLIMKTLREREDAASGEEGSWSESATSSNQQTDDEIDDIKEVDVSCTQGEHNSDEDGETHSSDEEGESQSQVSSVEIEECFLRQLEGRVELMNQENQATQVCGSDWNDSSISITRGKFDSNRTSDADSSRTSDADSSKSGVMENARTVKPSTEYWINGGGSDIKEVSIYPLACLPINSTNRKVLQLIN